LSKGKKKWLGELCENVHHIGEARATFSKLWLRSFLVQLELSWQGLPLRAVHGDEVISNMALMIHFSFLSFFLSSFLFLHLFYFLFLFRHEKEMHFFSNSKLDPCIFNFFSSNKNTFSYIKSRINQMSRCIMATLNIL
jgi:hypothetical protein